MSVTRVIKGSFPASSPSKRKYCKPDLMPVSAICMSGFCTAAVQQLVAFVGLLSSHPWRPVEVDHEDTPLVVRHRAFTHATAASKVSNGLTSHLQRASNNSKTIDHRLRFDIWALTRCWSCRARCKDTKSVWSCLVFVTESP